jgi:cell division septation protein DedD
LSREDLGGYVCHRLALAGGTRDRVSFSPAALDLVYRASVGVPRVINLVCDRALWRGQLEQVAVISPAIVAKAMDDLRLSTVSTIAEVRLADVSMPADRTPAAPQSPAFSQPVAPPSAPAAPRAAARVQPAVPRPNVDLPSVSASDLTALLDLTPTFRSAPAIEQDAPAFAPRTGGWQSRVAAQRLRRNALRFKFLRALLLPMLGMSVMLVAGSIAMNVQRSRSASSPAQPSWTTVPTAATRVTDSATAGDDQTSPAVVASAANSTVAPGAVAATIPNADGGRWFVQVAAFESPDRSAGLVQQLAKAGMPAYQVVGADGDLHFVRVGPFSPPNRPTRSASTSQKCRPISKTPSSARPPLRHRRTLNPEL